MPLTQEDKAEIRRWLKEAAEQLRLYDDFNIGFLVALMRAQQLYLEKLGLGSA